MEFTSLFIKRPVMSSAISLIILLLGLFSLNKLPLRLFPKVNTAVISIETNYAGASAQDMQGFITTTIEKAISGVEGVDHVTSKSTEGASEIKVHLKVGYDPNTAVTNLMQKVASVKGKLPKGADNSIIRKEDANDNPSLILAFASQEMSREQVGDYLRRTISPQIEAVNGVSQAKVLGNQYAMRIWLDPFLLAGHGVTADDVKTALMQQNIQATPGSTKGKYISLSIVADTNLTNAKQFNNVIVKSDGDKIVRLKDVGYAQLGASTYDISAVYNGRPAAVIFVTLLPGVNPFSVLKEIKGNLPEINSNLPYDLKANIVYDASSYMQASIDEVVKTIAEATLIVVLVIFLFLGSLRAVLIPVVTIPLSLIGICFFMLLLGYSINLLTLLAMVLAIGLVVDDAIVVVENIHRHIETGLAPMQASLKGIKEITSPVIAMAITLAAVYAPIGFVGGLTGQLFKEFAFALAGSVIISGIIALVLSPMMCSRLLKSHNEESKLTKYIDLVFNKIQSGYHWLLRKSLKGRIFVLVIWLGTLVGSYFLYTTTPKELSPKQDEGFIMVVGAGPQAANFDFMKKYSAQLNGIYRSLPAVKDYFYVDGINSVNSFFSFAILKDFKDRKLSAMQLQPKLQAKVSQIQGLKTYALIPPSLPGSQGMGVKFVLTSTGNYEELYSISQQLMNQARESGMFQFIDTNLKFNKPQVKLNIDRNLVAVLGVKMSDIANSLSLFLGGSSVQEFNLFGRDYDVIPQVARAYRYNPKNLQNYYVKTASGGLVPLSTFTHITSSVQPAELNHFQKFNSVDISGMLRPGYTLSQGLNFLTEQARNIMPVGMHYDFAGQSRRFLKEGNRMLVTGALAIVVIFLVLAIQFESYRDPLIILFGSIPMTLFAALIFLKLGFATINIYTQIGLLTLIGLVSKHGILMTKFANELRESEGLSRLEAIIKSAELRLRPILMTTAAMVFGVMPLILATGAGSISRFDIGIVIASGMLIGTSFTLFVVPSLYTFIAKKTNPT